MRNIRYKIKLYENIYKLTKLTKLQWFGGGVGFKLINI